MHELLIFQTLKDTINMSLNQYTILYQSIYQGEIRRIIQTWLAMSLLEIIIVVVVVVVVVHITSCFLSQQTTRTIK